MVTKVFCRASCRVWEEEQEEAALPAQLRHSGGYSNIVTDMFGIQLPVCRLAEALNINIYI